MNVYTEALSALQDELSRANGPPPARWWSKSQMCPDSAENRGWGGVEGVGSHPAFLRFSALVFESRNRSPRILSAGGCLRSPDGGGGNAAGFRPTCLQTIETS